MWHLVAQHWSIFNKPKPTEMWVQEELIFPPLPDRKTDIGYFTKQSGAFPEAAKRANPTCIEYYTKQH